MLEVYNKRALFDYEVNIATKKQLFSLPESDKTQNVEVLKTVKQIPWLLEYQGDPTILFSL